MKITVYKEVIEVPYTVVTKLYSYKDMAEVAYTFVPQIKLSKENIEVAYIQTNSFRPRQQGLPTQIR